jgi:hypothetical protein
MMAFLASLGIKDIFYGALIAAIVAFGVYERAHLINEGEAKTLATLAASTAKLTAANTAALDALAKADADKLDALESSYAKALATSTASASELAQRLRDYETASRGKVAVPGNPATSAGPDAPATKSGGIDDAVSAVISAAGHDAEQVVALQDYVKTICH